MLARSLILLLTLTVFGTTRLLAQPDSVANKRLIQNSLLGLQVDLNAFIQQNSEELNLFPCEIDTVNLRLVANYKHDTLQYPTLPFGVWKLSLEFDSWVERPYKSGAYSYTWFLSNIGLQSAWSWPGSFRLELQQEFIGILQKNTQNIAKQEHDLISYWMDNPPKGNQPELISSCQLRVKVDSNTLIPTITSTSFKAQAIGARYSAILLIDDSIYLNPIQMVLTRRITSNAVGNPFFDLNAFGELEMKRISIPPLSPGKHKCRLILIMSSNTWIDYRQTLVDGPAIKKEEKNATIGYLLSQHFEIQP